MVDAPESNTEPRMGRTVTAGVAAVVAGTALVFALMLLFQGPANPDESAYSRQCASVLSGATSAEFLDESDHAVCNSERTRHLGLSLVLTIVAVASGMIGLTVTRTSSSPRSDDEQPTPTEP